MPSLKSVESLLPQRPSQCSCPRAHFCLSVWHLTALHLELTRPRKSWGGGDDTCPSSVASASVGQPSLPQPPCPSCWPPSRTPLLQLFSRAEFDGCAPTDIPTWEQMGCSCRRKQTIATGVLLCLDKLSVLVQETFKIFLMNVFGGDNETKELSYLALV